MKKQILFLVMIIAVMGVVSGCQQNTAVIDNQGKDDNNAIDDKTENSDWKVINDTKSKISDVDVDNFIIPYTHVDSGFTFINLIGGSSLAIQYSNDNYTEEIAKSSQLVNNNIYYTLNRKLNVVDSKGKSEELDYVKEPVEKFIVSQDEKYIVFLSPEKRLKEFAESDIYLVNLNTKSVNRIGAIKENNSSSLYNLLGFINNDVYIGTMPGEIGGYIIFAKPTNLYKVSIKDNTVENIAKEIDGKNQFNNVSSDGRYLSTFSDNKIRLFDLVTGKSKYYDIPTEEGFKVAGNIYFSKNNEYLIYNTAKNDSENEQYRTVLIDLKKETQKTLVDDNGLFLLIDKWISDSKVLMRNYDDYYILDIYSLEMEKIKIIKNK